MDYECMVSVLCTAYNHEKYIAEALDSFLAQKTDFPFEVIVTDDASTDSTPQILTEYAEKYPDVIRYFHQEKNLYQQGAHILYEREIFPRVRGKYCAMCEGDDYWTDPDKLQLQVDFLEEHPEYSACVHNSYYHFCEGDRPDEPLLPARGDRDLDYSSVVNGLNGCFHTSSILGRSELMTAPPDYQEIAGSYGFTDYAIGIHLALEGKIRFIERPMSVYRVSSNAEAWSAGYRHNYGKLTGFVKGEIAMLTAVVPHLSSPEDIELTERVILERRYELNYLQGNVKALVSPEFKEIYKSEPLSFKAKTAIKLLFPGLHEKYRSKKGYGD